MPSAGRSPRRFAITAPTFHAGTGSALPFSVSGGSSKSSITSLTDAYTPGPTTTLPGSAAVCNRAAVFTASPVSMRSCGPVARCRSTSTSPASSPILIASCGFPSAANVRFSSDSTACISMAARTARSGSSSCARGIPKTASTASPMNFSRWPPYRVISADRRSKVRPTTDCTTSGSSRSAKVVEPTRSAKSAVANFRSIRPEACSAASGAPQLRQNFARSGFSSPQEGQVSMAPSLRRR